MKTSPNHLAQYSHPEVFKDITKGDNRACKTTGFPAIEGWDPVSGMGYVFTHMISEE